MVLAIAAGLAFAVGGPMVAGLPALAWTALLALAVQWIVFVPSYLAQTERYYDLTGTLTYVAVVSSCLAVSGVPARPSAVSLAVAGMVLAWSVRLGLFLFRRIHRDGGDGRFDDIKPDAGRFLVAWTLQGLWVWLTSLAAQLLILSAPPVTDWTMIGAAVWTVGWAVEVTADRQKSVFRADPANQDGFITTGLWAWSRHPNYFGEIVLWTGVFLMGVGTWQGLQWLTVLSPIFVAVLLTRISGVPLLEARADARWGADADYLAYKARTPVLVPRPLRG